MNEAQKSVNCIEMHTRKYTFLLRIDALKKIISSPPCIKCTTLIIRTRYFQPSTEGTPLKAINNFRNRGTGKSYFLLQIQTRSFQTFDTLSCMHESISNEFVDFLVIFFAIFYSEENCVPLLNFRNSMSAVE